MCQVIHNPSESERVLGILQQLLRGMGSDTVHDEILGFAKVGNSVCCGNDSLAPSLLCSRLVLCAFHVPIDVPS